LEELALTDVLTGLPNRRAIDVWATRELSAAARHGFSIWVAMADLDHFKSINDAHGHDAGDTVLKSFADILKSNTRESDMCARLGGEEFLVVFTHVEEKKREPCHRAHLQTVSGSKVHDCEPHLNGDGQRWNRRVLRVQTF
jgi:diguanylate cyclase (GGDEF)-like protein